MSSPLAQFLESCHRRFSSDLSGAVADYIPELGTGDPRKFGVSLATIDGHVYDIGDCATPFTIQSISKAFVFALALETVGADHVESVIGVEPSGDAFNSIRLTADNRPFNAMVNAGAIACSGLIVAKEGAGAFDAIRSYLCRFAGRDLDVDEAVYRSESATGDRNRAIAWLLKNYGRLSSDVEVVLDAYFRQCSILVTSHDLAVMAATLANDGINPVTGDRILSPYVVARTLSVMTSSGMYDYAGQWLYRVGMPAKSGVGGGIIASLPATFGLGTFSPNLDSYGNSVRGIRVCEALSSHFNLHVLSQEDDVHACILADYDLEGIASRRSRRSVDLKLLQERHDHVRILELVGALSFSTMDYITRRLGDVSPNTEFVLLDFKKVPNITLAAVQLFAAAIEDFKRDDVILAIAGLDDASPVLKMMLSNGVADQDLKRFLLLDDAIEWAEDRIIRRDECAASNEELIHLSEQMLLSGCSSDEISMIAELSTERNFPRGSQIISSGEPAVSLFFLQNGMVNIRLQSGIRLASISSGMAFGEMALLESTRSAGVWAETDVRCLELPLSGYARFCADFPEAGTRIMRNLASLLAQRLKLANTKIDILSA